jgi:cytoskeletal protein CcmA (bactofilin family)
MFRRRDGGGTERIDTLIGKAARVRGDVEFSGGLHLDGTVEGSVRAAPDCSSTVSVSEHGRVDGSVTAQNVVLNGAVRGDIVASGRVVLGARAWVEGNVLYGTIEMTAGAQVRGRLSPQESPSRRLATELGAALSGAGGNGAGTLMAPMGTNTVQST